MLIPVALLSALLLQNSGCSRLPRANLLHRVRIDGVRRTVRVPEFPRRIVSLAPSVTETLFTLGAGDRVVGVTQFCDYPSEARTRPRVGGMLTPSWEAILALRPDLLVATTSGNDRDLVTQSESLHLPLFFLDAHDIKSMLESIGKLGELVGAGKEGWGLEQQLRARVRQLNQTDERPRPTVLFLVWGDPIVVPGRGSFLDDVLYRAGCASITSDASPGWPTYDLEAILVRKPDWIIASRQNGAWLRNLQARPGWRELKAVREGRVGTVEDVIERSCPRALDAIEELRRLVRQ